MSINPFDEIKTEGVNPEGEVESLTTEEEEKVEEVITPEDKKDEAEVPFHEHPRFQKLYSELKSSREEIKELRGFRDETEKRFNNLNQEEKVPEWFADSFGSDPVLWTKFNKYQEGLTSELEKKIELKLSNKDRELEAARNWKSEQISKLEDKGYEFNKEELEATMRKFLPTDNNGNLDFEKGYEIYKMTKSTVKNSTEKRVVADKTQTSTRESNTNDEVYKGNSRVKHFREYLI